MKITESTARKILITDLINSHSLDPITVYIEDYAPGSGRITIASWDGTWSNHWGSMGEQYNIQSFIMKCSNDYLAGKFLNGKTHEPSLEATVKKAKLQVIKDRRHQDIGPDRARDLYDWLNGLEELAMSDGDYWHDIFGDEYWCQFSTAPTSECIWLCKILDVLREAFTQMESEAVPA